MKYLYFITSVSLLSSISYGQESWTEAKVYNDDKLTQIERLVTNPVGSKDFKILITNSKANYLISKSVSQISDTLIEVIDTYELTGLKRYGNCRDSLPKYDVTYNSDPIRYRIADEHGDLRDFPIYVMPRKEFYAMTDSIMMHYLEKVDSFEMNPDSFQISNSVELKFVNGQLISRSDINYNGTYGDTICNRYEFSYSEQQASLSQFSQNLKEPFSKTLFDFDRDKGSLEMRQFNVLESDSKPDTSFTTIRHSSDTLFMELPNDLESVVLCKRGYSLEQDYISDLMYEQDFGSVIYRHIYGRISPQYSTLMEPFYERDDGARITRIRMKGQPGGSVESTVVELSYDKN